MKVWYSRKRWIKYQCFIGMMLCRWKIVELWKWRNCIFQSAGMRECTLEYAIWLYFSYHSAHLIFFCLPYTVVLTWKSRCGKCSPAKLATWLSEQSTSRSSLDVIPNPWFRVLSSMKGNSIHFHSVWKCWVIEILTQILSNTHIIWRTSAWKFSAPSIGGKKCCIPGEGEVPFGTRWISMETMSEANACFLFPSL